MKTKIAIAGLGEAARHIHLPAYAKHDELEVVGGCDPTVDDADFGFPLYPSLDKMLEKAKPDILAVVTPTDTHFEITKKGLLAGCHVLCEKPFMSSLEEASEIETLSSQQNKWVVVNNQYRFMEIHAEAKRKIGTQEFGDLLFISANQTFFVSGETEAGWRGKDLQRTCKEFGIHVLDLCRFFFDEDPKTITARMPKGDKQDGPDYLNLIQLEFSGDRIAHILLDRLSRGPHRYLDMRLDGSEGIIETSLGGTVEFNAGVHGGSRKPYMNFDISMGGRARLYHGNKFRKIASEPLDLFANATSSLMSHFLDALKLDKEPPCSAADNKRTLALVYAAYESQEKNRPIELKF